MAELGKSKRNGSRGGIGQAKRERHTLKRAEILRGRNNFQLVFKQGRKFEGSCLRCLILADDRLKFRGGSRIGVGFTAPAALKRAVDRNRLKRLAREAYRLNKNSILPRLQRSPKPVALVFIYSSKVAEPARFPSFSEIEQDMRTILKSLVQYRIEGAG